MSNKMEDSSSNSHEKEEDTNEKPFAFSRAFDLEAM